MSVGTRYSEATENLLFTYFSLSAMVAGSRIRRTSAFECCLSPIPHPICNFAARLNLDVSASHQLAEMAEAIPSFQVYRVPGDSHKSDRLLSERGFTKAYSLVQMECRAKQLASVPSLHQAHDPGERLTIAYFMAEQFFSSHPQSLRDHFARATAEAAPAQLYYTHQGSQPTGAVMLIEAGSILGVYNLCVEQGFRNRGVGSELIRWCLHRGLVLNKPLTLQCAERLEPWYTRCGFQSSGTIGVHTLASRA